MVGLALESAAGAQDAPKGPVPPTHPQLLLPSVPLHSQGLLFRGKVAASNSMLWCSILEAHWKTEGDFLSVILGNVPRLCHFDSHTHPQTNSCVWRYVMLLLARPRNAPHGNLNWRWGRGRFPRVALALVSRMGKEYCLAGEGTIMDLCKLKYRVRLCITNFW